MARTIQTYILLLLLMATALQAKASSSGGAITEPQDSAVISLITCYPGSDIYELYGHTMLRVQYKGIDMVYNYGIFDFDAPNFIYRFVKGETDYKVAGYDSAYMLMGYDTRKVVEQSLNLTPRQSIDVMLALVENARPENATYRYNYVYDNCATRPRDIIERAVGDKLHYGEMHDTLTFRQEMRHYNANYAWQQFGIDLVLGSGIDYTLSYREQMFVPMVLMKAFAEAQVERDGRLVPLVTETRILNDGSETGDILPPTPLWFSPITVATALLILCLIFTWIDVRRHKVSRWLDSLLFGLAGIAGMLVFFLIFVSTHEATSPNFNGLWLHPLALVPAIFIWIKKAKRILYFYHFVNFAVIILLLAGWYFLPQAANAAAFPLMACLATRSLNYIHIYREKCRTNVK